MDPITAVGLASSAIQLGSFMFNLISGTRSIYKSASGASQQNETIEAIVLQLQTLTLQVSGSAANSKGRVDSGILESAAWCTETAQELLDLLAQLKRGEKTVWKSFKTALKSVKHGDRVDSLFESIGRMQLTLMTQLQFAISDKQSKMTETLSRIEDTGQKLGIENEESLTKIRDSIVEAIKQTETEIKAALSDHTSSTPTSEDRLHDKSMINQTKDIVTLVDSLIHQKAKCESDHAFLSSLQFPDMRLRQEAVKDAHSDTFQWIFEEEQDDNTVTHFPGWLREGNGIFWVRGKAGSGKSTLMKYLSQNPHTQDLLKIWAGDRQLAIARYFFWYAGSKLQKTKEGLIQTLLFELLRACPDAIPDVRKSLSQLPRESGLWAMSDLMTATSSLVACALPKRFCIFIDGLDEHDGDLDDLIELIEQLASSPNVKVCCSSRPWPSFADAFGQDKNRMLKLEDLTAKDIRKFVIDSFQQHKRFLKYARDKRFPALIEDIVDRANGVFLWVTLVVKSLRDGLTHADRIMDLERRLKAMPSDVEGLYYRMIRSVEPFYKEKSCELLLMMGVIPGDSIPAFYLDVLDELDDNPAILSHGTTSDIVGDPEEWYEDVARKLDARTKGLLELPSETRVSAQSAPTMVKNGDTYITVLHRSVGDFLKTPQVVAELGQGCRPDFDPLKRLLDASLILLLSPTIPGPYNYNYAPLYEAKLMRFLLYSRKLEARDGAPPMEQLRVISQRYPLVESTRTRTYLAGPVKQTLVSVAVLYGLDLYPAQVLQEEPDAVRYDHNHSVYSILFMTLSRRLPIRSTTVQLILKQGADLSRLEGDSGRTAWSLFLEFFCTSKLVTDPIPDQVYDNRYHPWAPEFRNYQEMKETFESLISHGADMGDKRAEPVIRTLFSPQDAEYLLNLAPAVKEDGNDSKEKSGISHVS